MEIKTVSDLANEIADMIGIYGACKDSGESDGCEHSENKVACCRVGFNMYLEEQIRLVVANETALDRLAQQEKWEIERVDRYWYWSSRNGKTYIELTHWFEPQTLQRKETKRSVDNHYGDHYSLPEWAKTITDRRKDFESDF